MVKSVYTRTTKQVDVFSKVPQEQVGLVKPSAEACRISRDHLPERAGQASLCLCEQAGTCGQMFCRNMWNVVKRTGGSTMDNPALNQT